jgi:beta-glucosidase
VVPWQADRQIPPLEGIARKAREKRIRLDWVLHDDEAHHDQMYYIARQSEVCLVFVSVYLVENWDRDTGKNALRLDKDGEAMIKRVESACSGQVVVVMHIGGQVIVEDWVSVCGCSSIWI